MSVELNDQILRAVDLKRALEKIDDMTAFDDSERWMLKTSLINERYDLVRLIRAELRNKDAGTI